MKGKRLSMPPQLGAGKPSFYHLFYEALILRCRGVLRLAPTLLNRAGSYPPQEHPSPLTPHENYESPLSAEDIQMQRPSLVVVPAPAARSVPCRLRHSPLI